MLSFFTNFNPCCVFFFFFCACLELMGYVATITNVLNMSGYQPNLPWYRSTNVTFSYHCSTQHFDSLDQHWKSLANTHMHCRMHWIGIVSIVVPIEQHQTSKAEFTIIIVLLIYWKSHLRSNLFLVWTAKKKNLAFPIGQNGVTWFVKSYENKLLIQSTEPHASLKVHDEMYFEAYNTEKNNIISYMTLSITQKALSRPSMPTIAV